MSVQPPPGQLPLFTVDGDPVALKRIISEVLAMFASADDKGICHAYTTPKTIDHYRNQAGLE